MGAVAPSTGFRIGGGFVTRSVGTATMVPSPCQTNSAPVVSQRSRAVLRPGRSAAPDFAFRFTPAAIDRLAAVEGSVGDFALALFSLILETDERLQIGFRVIASFAQLVQRGYLRLLLSAGPKVVELGARHGVTDLGDLRRVVAQMRARTPEVWEVE